MWFARRLQLTEVAESIKSGFKSQSQELQSKLDVFTGVTLNLKAEEHEAVKKLFISAIGITNLYCLLIFILVKL